MNYKCRVCGETTATKGDMGSHMCGAGARRDLNAEHANWMELYGVDFFKVCKSGKGCRRPLLELIEKECKIT